MTATILSKASIHYILCNEEITFGTPIHSIWDLTAPRLHDLMCSSRRAQCQAHNCDRIVASRKLCVGHGVRGEDLGARLLIVSTEPNTKACAGNTAARVVVQLMLVQTGSKRVGSVGLTVAASAAKRTSATRQRCDMATAGLTVEANDVMWMAASDLRTNAMGMFVRFIAYKRDSNRFLPFTPVIYLCSRMMPSTRLVARRTSTELVGRDLQGRFEASETDFVASCNPFRAMNVTGSVSDFSGMGLVI
ncbi:Aste57867_22785 [Aphanomyces stellatus]|uniref:Aste57867_22785 protein n=1 Tax=Aphanomyces stellatus TaxID=120398 RepID=A0A485LMK9_9STRA|nr:hypothetical protein As57867_022715 [Aphanomyces stellatus]VFT99438.1 Aste57867_22785 [Aphanomyces stellatus]